MDKKHTRTPVESTMAYSHEFWENYSLFLLKQSVKKGVVSWYVLRTKQYIAAFPEEHIRTHTPHHVEQFLNKVGRESRLSPWQFGQVVDAIRILFCLALKQVSASVSKHATALPCHNETGIGSVERVVIIGVLLCGVVKD